MNNSIKEYKVLTKKAIDDCDSIELSMYHLISFLADSKLDTDRINDVSNALKIIQNTKRSLEWKLREIERE